MMYEVFEPLQDDVTKLVTLRGQTVLLRAISE